MHKRDFLRGMAGGSLAVLFGDELWARYAELPAATVARDERFWGAIRGKYRLTSEYINLENGYYSMQSEPVLEAFLGHVRAVNREAAHYMWTRRADDKLAVRRRLAALAGCSADELIITRNTTESLDTIIAGIDWQAGDEAVHAVHDYFAMRDMFALQRRRHGMVVREVALPLHPASDAEIVERYAGALTPRTRLLLVSHVVNLTGQVLPVAAICAMARERGVPVMVDGAHAFAHLDFTIPSLGCDYYGASLHKWLGAPLGAGILYVRKDRIAPLWPLYGSSGLADDDIAKLNHTGIHPSHTDLAINDAIDFHLMVGAARKEARLRYLQRYWTDQVRDHPGITVNTPADPARAAGIANVTLARLTPRELSEALLQRFRIYTAVIDSRAVHGTRVTPHLFTTTRELDQLVRALRTLAA